MGKRNMGMPQEMDEITQTSTRRYHHGDLRQALLRAAEEELAEKGVEGFSLRGCAKRAGVSHAAPAHHFTDVTGLLSALAADGFERFLATTNERLEAAWDRPPHERLVAMGLGYIDFARANPALFRLMFSSNKADFQNEVLQKSAAAAFQQLVSGVGDSTGIDPHGSHEGQIQVAATWAIVHGLAHLLLSGQMKFLNERTEDELEADLASIISRISLN